MGFVQQKGQKIEEKKKKIILILLNCIKKKMLLKFLIFVICFLSVITKAYIAVRSEADPSLFTRPLGTCAEHAAAGLNPCMNGGTCVSNNHRYYSFTDVTAATYGFYLPEGNYYYEGLKCDCPSGFYGNICMRTTPDASGSQTFKFDTTARYIKEGREYSWYMFDFPESWYGSDKLDDLVISDVFGKDHEELASNNLIASADGNAATRIHYIDGDSKSFRWLHYYYAADSTRTPGWIRNGSSRHGYFGDKTFAEAGAIKANDPNYNLQIEVDKLTGPASFTFGGSVNPCESSNPCLNNGICRFNVATSVQRCECTLKWYGNVCEIAARSNKNSITNTI